MPLTPPCANNLALERKVRDPTPAYGLNSRSTFVKPWMSILHALDLDLRVVALCRTMASASRGEVDRTLIFFAPAIAGDGVIESTMIICDKGEPSIPRPGFGAVGCQPGRHRRACRHLPTPCPRVLDRDHCAML